MLLDDALVRDIGVCIGVSTVGEKYDSELAAFCICWVRKVSGGWPDKPIGKRGGGTLESPSYKRSLSPVVDRDLTEGVEAFCLQP